MDMDENDTLSIACQSANTEAEPNSGSGIILFLGIAVGIGGELLKFYYLGFTTNLIE